MKSKLELNANMIWCVIVTVAHLQGRTITYEEVGDLTGINHRNLGKPLQMVANYCEANKVPPITVLVVRKDTGVPSEGSEQFGTKVPAEIFQLQQQVYAFDWRTFTKRVDLIAA